MLHDSNAEGHYIMGILNSGPERRLFQTAEEEKASWDPCLCSSFPPRLPCRRVAGGSH